MSHLEPELIETVARETAKGAAVQSATGEVAAHLSSCAECRGHLRRAQGRQRLMAGMKPYTL